ncbi:MAG: hypothetical protein FJ012_00315 [Chloroflexi bacterium]|nr:hypothetical protein [Chloroflexota bacterium]
MAVKRKRAKITHKEETMILDYSRRFRKLGRTQLAEKIQAEVKWSGKPPEIEVLEKKISKYRKINDPEEEPWDMSKLDKYPIPPEALPSVILCYVYRLEHGDTLLTVREAKWVSRIYAIWKDKAEEYVKALDYIASFLALGEVSMEFIERSSTRNRDLATLHSNLRMMNVIWLYGQITRKPPSEELVRWIKNKMDEWPEELKAQFPDWFREADNERSHNQAIQE